MKTRQSRFLLRCIVAVLIVLIDPIHTARAAEISLYADASSPKVNESFTVSINLTGGEATLGTDVILRFDPMRLVVQRVSEGTLYPTYSPSGDGRINKEAGIIVLSGSTGFGQSVPANGEFGTITFVALKDGKTNVIVDYEPGATNKTGVVGPAGEELLTRVPAPLAISVKRASLFGSLLSFFQSLWRKK